MKKDIIEETEKRLFEEIQVMVEELPWDHRLNLEYFLACVHEAAHGVVNVRICQDFGNPVGLDLCKIEINIFKSRFLNRDNASGKTMAHPNSSLRHNFLFPNILAVFRQLTAMAGCILTDEFYSNYYGWCRVKELEELQGEYGAWSDVRQAYSDGLVGMYLSRAVLRLSYKDPLIRLTHLRLIRDILKGHGALTIDPRTYMK